jgi:heme exporter protein B
MSEAAFALTIARKDLLQESRSKAVTVATLFFSGIVLAILAFAVGPDPASLANAAPGGLWVALAFAGVISAAQGYQTELEDGALEQLLLYPIPRASIFLGKLLANWLYMSVLGLIMLPVMAVLFGAALGPRWPWLILIIFLGTLGFALLATFYAALTANLRARESLLPVLMFPIVVPVLLAAVRSFGEIALGNLQGASGWIELLAGFDLIYLVVCTAIFSFVVEE